MSNCQKLEDAAREFVQSVDSGNFRSRYTYEKFKEALVDDDAVTRLSGQKELFPSTETIIQFNDTVMLDHPQGGEVYILEPYTARDISRCEIGVSFRIPDSTIEVPRDMHARLFRFAGCVDEYFEVYAERNEVGVIAPSFGRTSASISLLPGHMYHVRLGMFYGLPVRLSVFRDVGNTRSNEIDEVVIDSDTSCAPRCELSFGSPLTPDWEYRDFRLFVS